MNRYYIIVYNYFNDGGTTRYVKNFKKLAEEQNDEVILLNYIYDREIENKENIYYLPKYNFKKIDPNNSFVIITREEFFGWAKKIKERQPELKIIGELHAPLAYTKHINFHLEYIDVLRASTPQIEKIIKKRYMNRVFSNYVPINHLTSVSREDNMDESVDNRTIDDEEIINDIKTINFYNITRFDELTKNIKYAFEIMKEISKEEGYKFYFYLNGYGGNEEYYRFLREYYGLENNVYINHRIPENAILLSTSNFETFGYSILEGLYQNGTVITTGGRDENLKGIYKNLPSVLLIDYDVTHAVRKIIKFISEERTSKNYQKSIEKINKRIDSENFLLNYKRKVLQELKKDKKIYVSDSQIYYEKRDSRLVELFHSNRFLKSLKGKPVLQKSYLYLQSALEKDRLKEISGVDADAFFIETFHGKQFSGDPKFIALEIDKKYKDEGKECRIYVSSVNSLVDSEILNYGFWPVRLGSAFYRYAFSVSKFVFINGNLLDRLVPTEEQKVVQTWHGMPLKKMVGDLEDVRERKRQVKTFTPRMKKWDYLISSSDNKTEVLHSSFALEENPKLKILNSGMPVNSYLSRNLNNVDEKARVYQKYELPTGKKILLITPTWKKNRTSYELPFGLDMITISDLLGDQWHIILKFHPLENDYVKDYLDIYDGISVYYNEFTDINELFLVADVLVTDFSSTMFDFMFSGRKIIIHQENIEEYLNTTGVYFDLEQEYGMAAREYSEEELVEEILGASQVDYKQILNNYFNYSNLDSSLRILEEILDNWE